MHSAPNGTLILTYGVSDTLSVAITPERTEIL